MSIFSELGKDARDLLNQRFHLGVYSFKVDAKHQNFGLVGKCTHSAVGKKVSSVLETKQTFPNLPGVTLTEKWSSENAIDAELKIEDQVAKGLTSRLQVAYNGFTGTRYADLRNTYKCACITANTDLRFHSAYPEFKPSLVFRNLNYVAGCELTADSHTGQIERSDFACGYEVADFAFHGFVTESGKRFTASVHQRINEWLAMAGLVGWTRQSNDVAWSVVTEMTLDRERKHSLKSRLDHYSRVSLSYCLNLNKDLALTLSGSFNGPDQSQIGMGVEFNPVS